MKIHYNKSINYTLAEQIFNKIDSLYFSTFYLTDRAKISWIESVNIYGEYTKEGCYIDNDGYWVSKDRNHNGIFYKFIWRIEPNYETAGKPCYTTGDERRIFNNSETKKYLLKLEKTQFCIEFEGFDFPTNTYWGLRPKQPHISIYENNSLIYSGLPINKRGYKAHLLNFLLDYYKFVK